jgi:hypothetical protein
MRARLVITIALTAFVVVAMIMIAGQATETAPTPATSAESAIHVAPSARPAAAEQVTADDPPPAIVSAEPKQAESPAPEEPVGKESPKRVAGATRPEQPAAPEPSSHKVVAMYFHGNVRCPTCRKVEAYAQEAVQSGFGPQIESGLVEFRAVNVDQPENRHFIDDFQLVNRAVVVTDEDNGAVQRFVKLDNVWALVGDREAYHAYVQDAVRGYLETH